MGVKRIELELEPMELDEKSKTGMGQEGWKREENKSPGREEQDESGY